MLSNTRNYFKSGSYHWDAFTDQDYGQSFGPVPEERAQFTDPDQTQRDPAQPVQDAEHTAAFSFGSNIAKTCRLQKTLS